MSETTPLNLDEEIKRVQLEAAKCDLELKRRELQKRPMFWKAVLTSPVLIAAVITGGITWVTANLTAKNATAQRESNLIIDAIRTGDHRQAGDNLKFLVEAGLISDSSGRLRSYLDKREPGMGQQVLPAN